MKVFPPAGSETILVLAPLGRDAQIACKILGEAGMEGRACAGIAELRRGLDEEVGAALVVEEAVVADLAALSEWVEGQPAWSDFPFILLSHRGGGPERNPAARRLNVALGNVSFMERPFHPTTLVSVARTALRGRRRQYEARARLKALAEAETLLEGRVAARTAELEAANRQLAEQIGEREKAQSALHRAQRLEAVGQLTSGVAHDFNNLLMVVLGNIRQLQKQPLDAAMERRLLLMSQAAQRGADLTAQMLAFSRRQKLDPASIDLNETVLRMQGLLESTMGGTVALEVSLEPNLWPAMIDPTQIELAVLNLAINARDAMEVGGGLRVETANTSLGEPVAPEDPAAGDYVMISVIDTGSGMTPEVLTRVFEPFFTTKAIGKGSGLGLSQVFGLAKQSGGGVRIESEPGLGTAVRIFLPRSTAAPSVHAEARRPAPDRPHDRLVLVVDDDDAVREVTAGMLTDLGYAVVEAASGAAALDTLDREPRIDALLVDFAMPGMNGAAVAREAQARRPDLPVLFVTGFADAAALAEAGDDGVLRKPFVAEALAAKLDAILTPA